MIELGSSGLSFSVIRIPSLLYCGRGKYEPRVVVSSNSTFPYLNFRVHCFHSNLVPGKISKSFGQALDQPLNYICEALPSSDILPPDVERVLYFDSDLLVVDDIVKLRVDLEGRVLAPPEHHHLLTTFNGRKLCYFNTGVMVVHVDKWRQGG
ncbi:hypothetical protein V6Z11_A08G082800 [Gossypium hirsutum]|uniref:Hexosyltransferase n=1 Tax=Gossypium hirsutum TaxID=3635 RepID=A0A1U8PW49_GOSHI|nr:probable galacturonosyltransferase-like 4 [Gossypium hirsutum]